MNFEDSLQEYENIGILKKNTFLDELEQICNKYPDKYAVIDTFEKISYKKLYCEISKYAKGLKNKGVNKGDKVLLQMKNGIRYVEILFAVMKIGASPVLLLQEHRNYEVTRIGRAVEASALIVEKNEIENVDYDNLIEQSVKDISSLKLVIAEENVTNSIDRKIATFDEIKDEEMQENYCEYRDVAVFLLSGGTTGTPKIIPKLHETYIYNAKAAAKKCEFSCETTYMAVLSASHDLALANPGVLGTLLSGGTVVFPQTAAFDDAFEAIEKYKVTATCIVPALATVWVNTVELYDNDLSSLKQIIIGASKLDYDLGKKIIEKFDVCLQQGYGLGEGVTCFTDLNDNEEVAIRTQGKPISEYDEIKIVNSKYTEVAQGEEGELIEKGPYTFGGYYENEQLNSELFTEDGFLKTGDKAKKDSSGNIIILGRVREQINRAGENVLPDEVETYLRKISGIKEASVFGMLDERLGEKTVACIVVEHSVDKKEIYIKLREMGIATYKFPDEIHYLSKLPYKNIGKIDKELLKTQIEQERKNG